MFNIKNTWGIAIGAVCALTAYFNSPEVADSVTRLVVAGGTGAATAVATDIGMGLSSALTNYDNAWPRPSGLQVLGVLAITGGLAFGGYKLARTELSHLAVGQEQRQQHTAPAPAQAPRVSLRELGQNGFRLAV